MIKLENLNKELENQIERKHSLESQLKDTKNKILELKNKVELYKEDIKNRVDVGTIIDFEDCYEKGDIRNKYLIGYSSYDVFKKKYCIISLSNGYILYDDCKSISEIFDKMLNKHGLSKFTIVE